MRCGDKILRLDRYIAANQGKENSLLGNDYDLEASADIAQLCRASEKPSA